LPLDQLMDFIDFIQNFHPTIKFTSNISAESVTFLDAKLSLQNQQISTSVHYKPTDSHSYLDYKSSHPPSTKDSIPYSQFLRLKRLCTNTEDFQCKALEMCDFFRNRQYPEHVIQDALHKATQVSREQALQPTTHQQNLQDRPVVSLLYHPTIHKVRKILLSNWSILHSRPEVADIFSKPPLIAYKRDTNLKDLLVKSRMKRNNQPLSAGTHPCSSPKCKTCPFICNEVNITSHVSQFEVRKHFTCRSTNLVYLIHCTRCKLMYIGETGRTLNDRISEHISDIRYNRDKSVARHFNQSCHSLLNLRVRGLWLMKTDNVKLRKETESYFIERLATRSPHGINEKS